MTCWLCGFSNKCNGTYMRENEPCQLCMTVAKIDKEIGQAVLTLRALLTKRCDLRSEQNRAPPSRTQKLHIQTSSTCAR